MYIYFDKQGVIKEIINDGYLRQGSVEANTLYFYFENDEMYKSFSVVIKRADGSLSNETALISTVKKEIPYNKNRDLKHFKDFKEYKFFNYTLTSEDLASSGLAFATVRAYDLNSGAFAAQGLITFNVEETVIKEDNAITESQYNYLIREVLHVLAQYAVTDQNVLDLLSGELMAKKAEIALKDEYGGKIVDKYFYYAVFSFLEQENKIQLIMITPSGVGNKIFSFTLPLATSSNDGLMSASDKAKLDNIENVFASQINFGTSTSSTDKKLTVRLYSPSQDKSQATPNLSSMTYTIDKATTSLAGLMSASDKANLNKALMPEDKGVMNGVAPLDSNAKLPLNYLYDSILGQLEYAGTFNGQVVPTMTQNLSPNRAVRKGDYFIAIGSGIINGIDFEIGDWLVFDNANTWQKIDNTDAVSSVNGKMGAVVLSGSDINIANNDNTKISAKFVSIDTILNDIYRKSDVYTKNEVESILNQLKAIYGWKDELVGTYNANNDIISNTIVEKYDYLIFNVIGGATGVLRVGSLADNDYIEIGDIRVNCVSPDLSLTNLNGDQVKVYGVKMEQQLAENIAFGDSDVDMELKRLNEKSDTIIVHDLDNGISENLMFVIENGQPKLKFK